MLRDDGKRSLDLDEIVESVKNQYANMATRSREEAENWNKKKVRINKATLFRDILNVMVRSLLDGRHGLQCWTARARSS